MANQTPLTPEENLLRIIESPAEAARGMRQRPRPPFDAKLYLQMVRAKYGDSIQRLATVRSLNIAFFAAASVATLFLFVDFWLGMPKAEILERLEASAKTSGVGDLSIEQLKPQALYMQEITGRNIFALAETPAATQAAAAQTPAQNPVVENIITAYRVVGIIWSETPQAILEDVKGGGTQLINRGSVVKGVRVKDILKDRVIMSYDGKDVELR